MPHMSAHTDDAPLLPFDAAPPPLSASQAHVLSILRERWQASDAARGWISTNGHCEFTLWGIRDRILSKFGVRYTETTISAKLRDLRKARFGSYDIVARKDTSGIWFYSLGEIRNG
jgi:hypothetical protein